MKESSETSKNEKLVFKMEEFNPMNDEMSPKERITTPDRSNLNRNDWK
jgi:hypothetical protein